MSEMIERVARAMCIADGYNPDRDLGFYDPVTEKRLLAWQYRYPDRARAAIAAMREPTEAMCAAGIEKDDELEWLQQERAIPQVYTAFIDAALA